MRSNKGRNGKIPLIADLVIAFGVAASFVFLVIVVEYHVGAGELTHAQLLLLGAKIRTAHPTGSVSNDNKRN